MKFKDPLATLQYMGGAIPVHISMFAYASYIYKTAYKNLDCSMVNEVFYPDDPDHELEIDSFQDVFFMLLVNAICIFLFTVNKNLNETSGGFAGYLKTFLKIICITLYMAGFIVIQFNLNQYMSKD